MDRKKVNRAIWRINEVIEELKLTPEEAKAALHRVRLATALDKVLQRSDEEDAG